uniref:Uncharacterized protein n=1 Tax=Octopus bimaculoides TaxID=37653 RepID=A0A0L8GXK7_OCTBM
MEISWKKYITTNKVFQQANVLSIETMLLFRQLRWIGHTSHMQAQTGSPQKHFKDQLKYQLTQAGIDPTEWEEDVKRLHPYCCKQL